ncbi:hypothetical protein LB523_28255 [Mesorhizobium sp. ESP-6-4]|nr:hypothetical protein [Mesorhizobium sp. ESP-6-4]
MNRAITEFAASKTKPDTALASTIAAWSDLQNAVIEFPETDIALQILSADPSLGIDRHAVEQALVQGLAAKIFDPAPPFGTNGLYDLSAEDSQALLASLIRNRQFDLALQAITVGHNWLPRKIWLAHYFASYGDLDRAAKAAADSVEAQDAAARGLLTSRGAKAALEQVDGIDYNTMVAGDTRKLETLLLIGQSKAKANDDAKAIRDALMRARDLASSTGRDCRAALSLAQAGLAKEATAKAGFSSDQWDAEEATCLYTMISIFAARGEDDAARGVIVSIDWVPVLPLLVRLAAAERLRGADAAALVTLAAAPIDTERTKLASAYAEVGFIEKATDEVVGGAKDPDTWAKILGAVAARDGVDKALKFAREHGVDVDAAATRSIALGGAVDGPAAAISMAKGDPQLAIDIGIVLTSRSNYEDANSAFAMAKTHDLTEGQAEQIRSTKFEIGLAVSDFAMAKANLPGLSESDTSVAQLIDAQLRAGHLDEAVKIVTELADNYYARSLKARWCWQIAMSMVKTHSPSNIANFISAATQVDLQSDDLNWGKLLVAAGQWSAALKVIERFDDYNGQINKAALYIAILNRI